MSSLLHETETTELARRIRAQTLRMVSQAKASHVGSCLSMADLLAVLYGSVLRVDPRRAEWADRDRFILSKGHGTAILFAVLAERGFFPAEWLDGYCENDSLLAGHATHAVPGVEVSTGSLGHGLPIGCGMALAAKRDRRPSRVFVLLSDGELDEGSNWESILFAPQHRLDNLVAIVDYNKIQSFGTVKEVLDLEPLADKWRACRWSVQEVDGHDHAAIERALRLAERTDGAPHVLIAHTTKGKGVSYMEDELAWHYRSPNPEQLAQAMGELGMQG